MKYVIFKNDFSYFKKKLILSMPIPTTTKLYYLKKFIILQFKKKNFLHQFL